MNTITLNNGITIPQLGLGVYKVANEDTYSAVNTAIQAGYRAIDTAQYYENEAEVGRAIKDSGIEREELFITTKVWNSHHGYERTLEAFESSIDKLGLDYVDLYLVHWPIPSLNHYVETYQALEKLYQNGRVKAIGVSNFHIEHLERILMHCKVKPVLNQVECHPYLPQQKLKSFCKQHDIFIECWCPLFRGGSVLEEPIILNLSEKYKKTPAQIVLRWHIQQNSIVIPKSVTPSRIKENINVFDFSLSDNEMNGIAQLENGERIGADPNEMDRTD